MARTTAQTYGRKVAGEKSLIRPSSAPSDLSKPLARKRMPNGSMVVEPQAHHHIVEYGACACGGSGFRGGVDSREMEWPRLRDTRLGRFAAGCEARTVKNPRT